MGVRLNLTNDEKLAQKLTGLESDALRFNVRTDKDINDLIAREKAETFNNKVEEYEEKFKKHEDFIKEYTKSIKENMNSIEIKANGCRVLIKPFATNPFQQIKVSESGLIIDTGGYTPQVKSNDTGEWEEQEQAIGVGTIIDAGPDCKYLKESDVVFYQKVAAVPVPFFKENLWTVSETQIIAVVNEGLTERFNSKK